MTIFELMDAQVNSYTKTDRIVYENIKKFPQSFSADSQIKLASFLNCSQAALTRFAKRFGFSGFNEFQYQLTRDLSELEHTPVKKSRGEYYSEMLTQTEDSVDRKQLNRIAKIIHNSSIIYTCGASIASIPAEYLDDSFKIADSNMKSGFLPVDQFPVSLDSKATVILFSAVSGSFFTETFKRLASNKDKPHTILITENRKHPLRKYFDEVVTLPDATSVNAGRAVMTETFSFLMFVDLLLEELSHTSKR